MNRGLILPKLVNFNYIHPFRDVHLDLFISPEVSISFYFFFAEAIINQISSGVIEIEWVDRAREEFSKASSPFHRSKDLVGKLMPLFFAILLVENTVALVLEPYASQTIRTSLQMVSVVAMVEVGAANDTIHMG